MTTSVGPAALAVCFLAQTGLISLAWLGQQLVSAPAPAPSPASVVATCPAPQAAGYSLAAVIAVAFISFLCGVGITAIYTACRAISSGACSFAAGAGLGAAGASLAKPALAIAPYRGEPGDSESD